MKILTTILERGEDHVTEFKSSRFHNESLAKEIVAFSNSSGGSIFIGIEDDGSIRTIRDRPRFDSTQQRGHLM